MKLQEFSILLAIFLDLLGFSMILPDIQFRARELGASGLGIGLILASTFVVQFITSPRWGRLSDVTGRKNILMICTAFSALSMLLYGIAGSIWLILLSRMVAGLGGANVAIAQAYIADATDDETRSKAMGRITAAISLGMIVGPAIGGFLADPARPSVGPSGNMLVGLTGGCFSLLGLIWIWFALKNVRPTHVRSAEKYKMVDLRFFKDFPQVIPLVFAATVAWFALASLEGTFGQLIKFTLGYGQKEYGIIFSYESLLGVIVPAVLLAYLTARFREPSLLRLSYLFQAVGLVGFTYAGGMGGLLLAATLFGFGAGVANPTINSLCSRLVTPNRQGELFGMLQSTRSLGFAVGPPLGGYLFDIHPYTPYLWAGAVCLLAVMLVRIPSRASIPEELAEPILSASAESR